MLNPSPRWLAFEAQDERATYAHQTYEEALRAFASLWDYARQVNPTVGVDWEADLAPDLAVARAVNGLPPS